MRSAALSLLAIVSVALVASGCASATGRPDGGVLGVVRLVGGDPKAVGVKTGVHVSVLDHDGRIVAQQQVGSGGFRFRLPAGSYQLGLGTPPTLNALGGCPPPVVTIRSGRTTHKDLLYGCLWR